MKIKTLIIEDEAMARDNLVRKLQSNFPDFEIVGSTSSVKNSVKWLKSNEVDVIFMDIELSDGLCFDIFKQMDVRAKVIITTAYNCYAIKAFEEGTVDYLLKPISIQALFRAISRVTVPQQEIPDYSAVGRAIENGMQTSIQEERFLIRLNDKIIPVKADEVAYVYSENKNNLLMTRNGISYVIEASLDDIYQRLNPKRFYKISRNCLISIEAITCIYKQFGGKYRIETSPTPPYEITVSRGRIKGFLEWLDKAGMKA